LGRHDVGVRSTDAGRLDSLKFPAMTQDRNHNVHTKKLPSTTERFVRRKNARDWVIVRERDGAVGLAVIQLGSRWPT